MFSVITLALKKILLTQTDPRDALSRPIAYRAVDKGGRLSTVDSTWPRPPSGQQQTDDCRLFVAIIDRGRDMAKFAES